MTGFRGIGWSTLLAFAACTPESEAPRRPEHLPRPPASISRRAETAPTPEPSLRRALPPKQGEALKAWFARLGDAEDNESFEDLLIRVARSKLGTPYREDDKKPGPESLYVDLEAFQCVSFIESTLAVARCVWGRTPDESCFVREIEQFRYRDGKQNGYLSRLHYFSDWLTDNARRQRIELVGERLGGVMRPQEFNFMTRHRRYYPALLDEALFKKMQLHEQTLSRQSHYVLGPYEIDKARTALKTGDIAAIVTSKKGLLVAHVGFIDVSHKGTPRLLHASRHHGRVLLTKAGIDEYIAYRPEREGIMIGRPKAQTLGAKP